MGAGLGRISGPLLTANLLRQGVDLAFETNLLYLNVNTGRVGIKTDGPTRDLLINGDAQTINLLVDNNINVANLQFVPSTNTIRSTLGDLFLTSISGVTASSIDTDFLDFDNNTIRSLTTNKNIEIRPNGAGEILFYTPRVDIAGNLHSTGNITIGGNVIIGDDTDDAIIFNADVNSNLIPDQTALYSIGSEDKRWLTLYTGLHNGQTIQTGGLSTDAGINLALRPGKIWYVAANGLDTNQGNHANGPFATLAKALSVAQTGDAVHIYPGTYTEVFPLVLPTGVDVLGVSLRSVKIVPTELTRYNDAFHLTGECTISNITVSDFFYDSINDTGYGFRFSQGAKTVTRSPYITNVSVITHGSVTSESDPRGFASGDAGKGALVDGAVMDSTSVTKAMLFHSVTFMTPNVDGLTVTNGVRVEWLNSFTYFANRGLYATEGTLGFAGLGTEFGAEVRSIGSANVYGNYGAVAIGPHTLMYLIQHNFGYIGSGNSEQNDLSLVIQENETVELDHGKIYYQSMDQTGDFRVGDTFHADFQTGLVSINGISVTAGGVSSINFADADSETNIDSTQINTDNIKFSGHTISSLFGPVNLVSYTGDLNLTQNVLISKDMHVTGFMHLDGELTLGNQPIDIVEFNAPVEYDFVPKDHNTHSLGSNLKRWLAVYTTETRINDTIVISGNTVATVTSNTDLRLQAIAGNKVVVSNTDVELDQNLSVNTTTNLDDLNITGLLTHFGNVVRTGDSEQAGNIDQTGILVVTDTGVFDDITIDNNSVTSVATLPATNVDLVLKAATTGEIYIPSDNVTVEQSVTVNNDVFAGIYTVTGLATANELTTNDISIIDNVITTTIGNNDLQLEVAGTGKLSVPLDNVEFDQTLTVGGSSTLKSVYIGATGVGNAKTLTHGGDYLLTGAINQTGDRQISGTLGVTSNAYFKDIDIITNIISTKGAAPLDLVLKAVGTGIVKSLKPVYIGQTLGVTGTTYTSDILNSATVTSDIFTTGDISIDNNVITTTQLNSNLSLRSTDLTKNIYVPNNNVVLGQNLTVLNTTNLATSIINGTVTHYGTLSRTGNTTQTGAYQLDNISNNNNVLFTDVSFIDNRISSRTAGHDLDLRAVGTGKINLESDNVYFNQTLRVDGILATTTINNTTSTTTSNIFTDGNIEISSNLIKTTSTDSNLILVGNGTGSVFLEKLKFNNNIISTDVVNNSIIFTPATAKNVTISSTTALKVPTGTSLNRPVGIQGDLRFNTDDNLFGGWSTARRTMGGVYSADRRTYARAHPTANTISFVTNLVPAMDVLGDRLRVNGLTIDNIQLDSNTFTAIPANTDLLLQPNGTGNVVANKIKFESNLWTNLDSALPLVIKHTADGHLKFGGTYGIVIPAGDTASQPAAPEVGDLRFNTEDEATEVWEGTRYIPITGTGDIATAEIVQELGDVWSLILG